MLWKMDFVLCMNVKMIEPFIMQMLKRVLMQMQKIFLIHINNVDA